ncbi:MAG: DUF4013 domain-containing protein [Anaerolineae bacterium]
MTLTQQDFTWMFRDPEWKQKFLTGSLIALAGLIPPLFLVAGPLILGYALILMRSQMRSEPRTLPRWTDFGQLFIDGVKALLASAGYVLPGYILWFIDFALVIVLSMLGSFGLAAARESPDQAAPFASLFLLQWLGFVFFFAVGWVLAMIGLVFTPVAMGEYLRTGRIGAGYQLRQVWGILRANAGGFALAWLVYFGIAFGLSFAVTLLEYTIILCCLIPFLMAPIQLYIQLMFAQLFGAAYRDGAQKAGLLNTTIPNLTAESSQAQSDR